MADVGNIQTLQQTPLYLDALGITLQYFHSSPHAAAMCGVRGGLCAEKSSPVATLSAIEIAEAPRCSPRPQDPRCTHCFPNPKPRSHCEACAGEDDFHPEVKFSFTSSEAGIRTLEFPAGKVVLV